MSTNVHINTDPRDLLAQAEGQLEALNQEFLALMQRQQGQSTDTTPAIERAGMVIRQRDQLSPLASDMQQVVTTAQNEVIQRKRKEELQAFRTRVHRLLGELNDYEGELNRAALGFGNDAARRLHQAGVDAALVEVARREGRAAGEALFAPPASDDEG
jgi:mevalonate kinase